MQNYSSLEETHEPDETGTVLVQVAEPARARWNHVKDLDSFFQRMYQYHQQHGFFCMLLQRTLELLKYIFIIFLTAYVVYGVNYKIILHKPANIEKLTLADVILSFGQCIDNFTLLTWCALIIALFIWLLRLIRCIYKMIQFWDIKQFYNIALHIDDSQLDNLTWHEIQTKVRNVQIEQQMCIHKRELSELDIYHRILRQTNYLVAMVNKRIIPPRLKIPFIGEFVFWTSTLQMNLRFLLFLSPWSLFQNPWELGEDYKKYSKRHELANKLKNQIFWLVVLNLIFSPLILIWQCLYAVFSQAAIIRREPGILALRRWSLYGKLYLRHFNELDHELQARLSRAYRPATKYLAAFQSPVGTIIAENLSFYVASIFAVFMGITLYDESFLNIDHVVTTIAVLGAALHVLRKVTPDETTSSDLEDLLNKVMLHTHYLPTDWIGQAHTTKVRSEFEQIFQYSFITLLESILSPILTPYVLYFYIRPRSLEIIDFFRNFTVDVVGVGDVCSFAQMDIREHGNPAWHEKNLEHAPDQFTQAEDGKVELSLIHFTHTNPSWRPPPSVEEFVKNVQNQSSLLAGGGGGGGGGGSLSARNLDSIVGQQQQQQQDNEEDDDDLWRIGQVMQPTTTTTATAAATTDRHDIPLYTSDVWRNRLESIGVGGVGGGAVVRPYPMHMSSMSRTEGPSPLSIRDMSLSASYLHNVHNHKIESNRQRSAAEETTPLLSSNH